MRHKDNLKVEGEFKARRTETSSGSAQHMTMKEKLRNGERMKAVKHQDNLRVGTGEFTKREQHTVVKGERAEVSETFSSSLRAHTKNF